MKKFLIALIIILSIFAGLFFTSPCYMPALISNLISTQLGAEVEVKDARLCLRGGVVISGVSLSNNKGLHCSAEKAVLRFGLASLAPAIKEKTLYLPFRLSNVKFQSSGRTAVGSIADALGFDRLDGILFDRAEGEFYLRDDEVVLKGIEASGEHIKLSMDGTIRYNDVINCSLKMLLSEEVVSSMPESTRKLFFRQDESWSKVELYLSGDISRPAVSFTTPLFKLTVR